MAEWSKANGSKSFNRKLFVGSNPTLSVLITNQCCVNPTKEKELIISLRCCWTGTLNFLLNYYHQSEKKCLSLKYLVIVSLSGISGWFITDLKCVFKWSKLHMSDSGFPKIYSVTFFFLQIMLYWGWCSSFNNLKSFFI